MRTIDEYIKYARDHVKSIRDGDSIADQIMLEKNSKSIGIIEYLCELLEREQ